MQIEKYKKLALLLNEARAILYDDENSFWKTPKSKSYSKWWKRSIDGIDKARCWLEELMFEDCPEEASVYIFYPNKKIIEVE